jgi:hypothetical protein
MSDQGMKRKQPGDVCREVNCDCEDPECNHQCCAIERDSHRSRALNSLSNARDLLPPCSPAYKHITQHMAEKGYVRGPQEQRDLSGELDSARDNGPEKKTETSAVSTLNDNMIRNSEYARIAEAVTVLDAATDLYKTMTYLYHINREAEGHNSDTDMELLFRSAIRSCHSSSLKEKLRSKPQTNAGWKEACLETLTKIDGNFVRLMKLNMKSAMKQEENENPSQYAERCIQKLDMHKYFLNMAGSRVDDADMALDWVGGLLPSIRGDVRKMLVKERTYNIDEALIHARASHDNMDWGQSSEHRPLQNMSPQQPAPPGPPPMTMETVERLVAERLQKMTPTEAPVTQAQMSQLIDSRLRDQQNPRQDAYERPNRARPFCGKCNTEGHTIETCYRLNGWPKRPINKPRHTGVPGPVRLDTKKPKGYVPYLFSDKKPEDKNRDRNKDKDRGQEKSQADKDAGSQKKGTDRT